MLAPLPFMSPKLVDVPPAGDGWLHEIKYDGYRTQVILDAGQARALTRKGHDWSKQYAPIVEAAGGLPCESAIIDGEVCVQDDNGVTDFGAVRSAIASAPHRLVFFAFDLLHLNGHDLRPMILEDRRELLTDLLEHVEPPIVISQEFDGDGASFFAAAEAAQLEGIVSKRKGSRYVGGDSDLWVKVKAWVVDDFDVIGVKKGDDGLPYALFAKDGQRMGAAIVSLPGKLRNEFWAYVEASGSAVPLNRSWREKNTTWLPAGVIATVRYLRGSDKLRHASIKELVIPRP